MKVLSTTANTAVMAAILAVAASAAQAEVKLGFLGGFTGPIESLTPPIFEGAKLAAAEINAAGGTVAGEIVFVEGDTGCSDATKAASAADRMVNTENVTAIVGALCSGATTAAANAAAVPGGVVMISPASTAPTIAEIADNDLVFRTAPSDGGQGPALAKMVLAGGVKTVAVTYVNNDYGKGFAESFAAAFAAGGGQVLANLGHEDNKADYRAEIGNLEATGAEALVVLAYADSSGQTILRQADESGVFQQYVGGDGMVGDKLVGAVGGDVIEGMIASRAAAVFAGTDNFAAAAMAAGLDPNAVYAGQAYDAAFLLALAIEKNGSADRAGLSAALRDVASAPGEVVLPGEWAKAKKLIAEGKAINYEGATGSHDFDEKGDVAGVFAQMAVQNGQFVQVGLIEN